MLSLKRADIDSVDWAYLDSCPDQTVFQTRGWLSFIAETQDAEPVVATLNEGQHIVGYFTGLITNKFGLRILGSPFRGWTTQYMGFCPSPGIRSQLAISALRRFVFEDLRCVHLEIADRSLALNELNILGFEHSMEATFEIDLTLNDDTLLSNMSKSCRWCIRKAQKNGVVIEEAHDLEFADDYYAQLKDVFAKQSLVPTYGVERVRALLKHMHPTGRLLLLRARDPEGRCIATGIFAGTNRTAFLWGAASWRKYQNLLPNEMIQWYAMTYWRERGISVYDMGGGGDYKRKYGGVETSFPWFRMSKHRSISYMRNFAQQYVKTRQVLLGKWKQIGASTA
jgi:CelD/BcsL family acetyltransferase involved in cellulose biosynthesis